MGVTKGKEVGEGECNLACISHRYMDFMDPGQQEGWAWHLITRALESGYDTALSPVGLGLWAGVTT